jgi:hypothetical protein
MSDRIDRWFKLCDEVSGDKRGEVKLKICFVLEEETSVVGLNSMQQREEELVSYFSSKKKEKKSYFSSKNVFMCVFFIYLCMYLFFFFKGGCSECAEF